jgi:hypothetical protein
MAIPTSHETLRRVQIGRSNIPDPLEDVMNGLNWRLDGARCASHPIPMQPGRTCSPPKAATRRLSLAGLTLTARFWAGTSVRGDIVPDGIAGGNHTNRGRGCWLILTGLAHPC